MMPVSDEFNYTIAKKSIGSSQVKESAQVDYGRELLNEAKFGNLTKVKKLIGLGAAYTADWLGITPLYHAVYHNYIEIVELLLQSGVALNVRNKVDRTPLHVACQMGHVEVVKLLLAFGADVTIKDMLKMSPLHWAVESRNAEIVKLVLNHGCPLYCIDKFGKSPTDIAEDKGDYHIARLIQDARDMTAGQRSAIVKATKKLSQTYAKAIKRRKKDAGGTPKSLPEIHKNEAVLKSSFNLLLKKKKLAIILDKDKPDSTNDPLSLDPPVKIKEEPVSPPPSPECANGFNHKTVEFLEAHGIKMLEPDTGTVVSSAVASGQSVRLTEAGKLALISSKPEKATISMPAKKHFILIPKEKPKLIFTKPGKSSTEVPKDKLRQIIKPTSPNGLPVNLLGNGKKIIKVNAEELIKMASQKKFVIKTSSTPNTQGSLKPIPKRKFEGKLYTNLDHYIEAVKLKKGDCEKNISELRKLLDEKYVELATFSYLLDSAIKEKSARN